MTIPSRSGKRARGSAGGGGKRAKGSKGEKQAPLEEEYKKLTVPQLKAVLLNANVRPPLGKTSKGDLVALCVQHDDQCRHHIPKE